MKKISIITVNKDNGAGLRATAQSVVSQSCFSDIEWIVIDGCSSDDSVQVIREYESYIDYWVSEKDTGIYSAMNKGVRAAHGEYVIFRNSGDLMFDERVIEKFINHPTYGHYDYCSGITRVVSGKRIEYDFYPSPDLTVEAFYRWAMPHASTFIKRSRFSESLYDESMKISADTVHCFRDIIVNNASYAPLDFFVSIFEAYGISSNHENAALGIIERDRGFKECLPPRIYDNIYYMHGKISSRERRLIRYTWSRTWEYKVLCFVALLLNLPRRLWEKIYKIKR